MKIYLKVRWDSLSFPYLGIGYCKTGMLPSFQMFPYLNYYLKIFFFSFPFQPVAALCSSLFPVFIPLSLNTYSATTPLGTTQRCWARISVLWQSPILLFELKFCCISLVFTSGHLDDPICLMWQTHNSNSARLSLQL